MKRIVVLHEMATEAGVPLLQEVADFESVKDADLWLKNEAPDGVFHTHSRLREPFTVQSESVTVRNLIGGKTLLQRTRKEKGTAKETKAKTRDKK